MVLRGHPFHLGHSNIISYMCNHNDVVIAALGSTGTYQDFKNPWTQADRVQMIRNVYGDRVSFVYLEDIGASEGKNDWCDYVLEKCKSAGFERPTDYYSGSEADIAWYRGRFDEKHLHVMDRALSGIPSATDIRTMLAHDDSTWKKWVPAVNHSFVEHTYPKRFKLK